MEVEYNFFFEEKWREREKREKVMMWLLEKPAFTPPFIYKIYI